MYATLVSGDRTLSGDMLEQRVRRVAGGLTALGLVAGDVLGILMRNDFPVFEVALAAERIGVVAVPLNWHGTPEEVGYILADSQARALFAHTDLLRVAASAVPAHCRVLEVIPPPEVRLAYRLQQSSCTPTPGGLEYEAWVGESVESSSAPIPPPFRLLYTSGTTGRPKGVKRAGATPELAERMGRRVRVAHGLEQRPIRAVMTGRFITPRRTSMH